MERTNEQTSSDSALKRILKYEFWMQLNINNLASTARHNLSFPCGKQTTWLCFFLVKYKRICWTALDSTWAFTLQGCCNDGLTAFHSESVSSLIARNIQHLAGLKQLFQTTKNFPNCSFLNIFFHASFFSFSSFSFKCLQYAGKPQLLNSI